MQFKHLSDAVTYLQSELGDNYRAWMPQALGFDASGKPLAIDSKHGPKTRAGRFLVPSLDDPPLVQRALLYLFLGAKEHGGNNRGSFVAHFFGRDLDADLRGPAQWCAAFVSTCLRETFHGVENTWGARRLADKSPAASRVAPGALKPGDVITWQRVQTGHPYAGHIGIVCHVEGGRLYAIEGNAGKDGQVRVWAYDAPEYKRWGRDAVWKCFDPDLAYPAPVQDQPVDYDIEVEHGHAEGFPQAD